MELITFSIATNYDVDLINGLACLNATYKDKTTIAEVFGSLPTGLIGSGRAPIGLPDVTPLELKAHIVAAHKNGLRFNYLMNAPSTPDSSRKVSGLKEEIDALVATGIDSLTVANEVLIQYLRKEHQDVKIDVSVIKGVDTPDEARRLSDMGVHSINLNQHTLNRNPKKIEQIVRAVSCEVRLYANVSCLASCYHRNAHYAYLGKKSRTGVNSLPEVDPFIAWCALYYLEHPIELLKSPFIRPEDVKFYRDLGVSLFKLSDRREPTTALLRLADAYMSQEFHGNLFDLLFREGRKWSNAYRFIPDLKDGEKPPIGINNDMLSELVFYGNVTGLEGVQLAHFYEKATQLAVSGLDDPKTIKFIEFVRSLRDTRGTNGK